MVVTVTGGSTLVRFDCDLVVEVEEATVVVGIFVAVVVEDVARVTEDVVAGNSLFTVVDDCGVVVVDITVVVAVPAVASDGDRGGEVIIGIQVVDEADVDVVVDGDAEEVAGVVVVVGCLGVVVVYAVVVEEVARVAGGVVVVVVDIMMVASDVVVVGCTVEGASGAGDILVVVGVIEVARDVVVVGGLEEVVIGAMVVEEAM